MTSDMTQHAETERAYLPAGVQRAPREGSYNLRAADAGARHAIEKDGLTRAMGAATALLNKAYMMIERSEALLLEREMRIRELEELSLTDELTGLMNRRGFFEAFRRETGRAARGVSQGGLLILLDIDNFHAVNKNYGQEAGDVALKLIAATLKNEIRAMDLAARLGSDEFVLLFADTDKTRAMERAQHLALRMNNLSFIWHGAEICISASVGLKNYGANDHADGVFRAADRHLHSNKEKKGAA